MPAQNTPMSEHRKHIFVFNPQSFIMPKNMEQLVAEIHNYFRKKKDAEYSICYSKYPRYPVGHLHRVFENVSADVTVRVYAVGGDGILFDCLNGIAGFPNAELAAIPYGSSNNFIRSFGENNLAVFRNIEEQINAPIIPTDIMNCGNNYALNVCTLGMASYAHQYVMRYSPYVRGFYGIFINLLSYLGTMRGILDKKIIYHKYEIILDGVPLSGNFCNILIANGPRSGNNLSPVPQARPDDGELNVLAIQSDSAFSILRVMPSYWYCKKHPLITRFKAKNVVINSDEPMLTVLDGQLFYEKHISISVIPSAVKFVAVAGLSYSVKGIDI
ncbi:MAG: diacylglycerol kinase family lipid kinase [Treponemataceae bacterium]|nr:MAG: diacylglycerol kinase family lipid kinase [Treponemataceae bacterium]